VAEKRVVESGSSAIKLAVAGQTNRAVDLAADGRDTKAYLVGNDGSNARPRVEEASETPCGATRGAVVELGIGPDNPFDASREDEDAGANLGQRIAEVHARHDDWGRLSFGRGQAAADDAAEYDQSLAAGPLTYAGVAVGDALFDSDGDRRNRVGCTTPAFGGLRLDASAGADQRDDAALEPGYDHGGGPGSRSGPPRRSRGAIQARRRRGGLPAGRPLVAAPRRHGATGLGLTLSAGGDRADGDDPCDLHGKLSRDHAFVDRGGTGLGVDPTRGENLPGPGRRVRRRAPGAGRGYLKMSSSRFFV
jgi:hypothetical protein